MHFEPATFGDISILSGFHILADYESRPRMGVAGAMGQAMLPRRLPREQSNYVIFPFRADDVPRNPNASRGSLRAAIQNAFLDEYHPPPSDNADSGAGRHRLLQFPERVDDHALRSQPGSHLRLRVRSPPSAKDLSRPAANLFPEPALSWTNGSTRGSPPPSSTPGSTAP